MSTCRPRLYVTYINRYSPGRTIYVKPGDKIHIHLSIKSNANCEGFYEVTYTTSNKIGTIKEETITLYSDSLYVDNIYYTVEENMRIYIKCGYIKNNTKIITDSKGPWIIRIKEPTSTKEHPTSKEHPTYNPPTYNKKPACTVDDFVNSYLKHSKIIKDVTSIVKQVIPNTEKAFLFVHTVLKNKIRIIGPYNSRPHELSPEQIVHNWLHKEEWVRMFCSKDRKYYWVVFPCDLIIKYRSQPTKPHTSPTEPTEHPTTQPTGKPACTVDDFIHSYLKHNKIFKNVTSIVKQVIPNTKKAILFIHISIHMDKNRIKIKGPYNSRPHELSPNEIVNNWLHGEEWVRMKCSKDGKWYWVIFPCKLVIEKETTTKQPTKPTEHPTQPIRSGETMNRCTANDFIRSYLNYYHNNTTHDVTNIVKQVYHDTKRAILKVYTNRIIAIIGPYNNRPHELSPEQMVKNWLHREEWVRMKCSKDEKYYWVVFPCKLEIEKQPQPTEPHILPIEQPTHPTQPTPKPIEQPTKKQTCTADDFANSYLKHSKIIKDVTDIVKQVIPNVKNAKLYVHTALRNKIRIIGPFDSRPHELSPEQMVNNWLHKEEWVRMICSKDGKWYWVVFPCDLIIKYTSQPTPEPIKQPTKPTEPHTPPTQPTEHPTQPTTPETPITKPTTSPGIPIEELIPIGIVGMIGTFLLLRKR